MNVTINLDRGDTRSTHAELWPLARAILEAIEPGAGAHCIEHWKGSGGRIGWTHHRLGVDISVYTP